MTGIDTNSQTWRAVKAWAEQELEHERRRLEALGLPQDETEQIRGAIRTLRQLVKLPEPSKLMQPIESTVDVD